MKKNAEYCIKICFQLNKMFYICRRSEKASVLLHEINTNSIIISRLGRESWMTLNIYEKIPYIYINYKLIPYIMFNYLLIT
jgi:hypothetical protein